MKKTLLKTLMLGGVILTFQACKKEVDNQISSTKKTENSKSNFRMSSYTFREIDITPQDLINAETFLDENDEKINCALYELSRAFIHSVNSSEMVSIFNSINSNSNNSPYESIELQEVFSQYPELKNLVEAELVNGNNFGLPYNFNSFQEIENVLVREDVEYTSTIHLVNNDNEEIIDYDGSKILLSSSLSYETAGEDGTDDYHAFLRDAGSIVDIRIGELEANSITLPLFTIDLKAKRFNRDRGRGKRGKKTTSPQWLNSGLSFKLNKIKMYSRLENDKKSEIHVIGKVLTEQGRKSLFGTVFNKSWCNKSIELAVIHKDDINGSVRNLNGTALMVHNYSPTNILRRQHTTVMNVYERDWINDKKVFGWIPIDDNGNITINYQQSTGQGKQDWGVWGDAKYATDYIYAESFENDGRANIGIDDNMKDNVFNNNGLWKGDYAGDIFMKIE